MFWTWVKLVWRSWVHFHTMINAMHVILNIIIGRKKKGPFEDKTTRCKFRPLKKTKQLKALQKNKEKSQTRHFSFTTTLTFGFSPSLRPPRSCEESSHQGQGAGRGGWCTSLGASGHLLISAAWHTAGSLKMEEKKEHPGGGEGMATAGRVRRRE